MPSLTAQTHTDSDSPGRRRFHNRKHAKLSPPQLHILFLQGLGAQPACTAARSVTRSPRSQPAVTGPSGEPSWDHAAEAFWGLIDQHTGTHVALSGQSARIDLGAVLGRPWG